jgi:hypothetical protein
MEKNLAIFVQKGINLHPILAAALREEESPFTMNAVSSCQSGGIRD